MLLCEYRIVLPLSVAEYQRGMLYMICKSSIGDSAATATAAGAGAAVAPTASGAPPSSNGNAAAKPAPTAASKAGTPTPKSGVVFVKNEPYTDNPHGLPPGQYTEKTYFLDAHLPTFLTALLPTGAGVLQEYAWNAFPFCVTAYESPYMGPKFSLVIRSTYVDAPQAGVPVDGPATEEPTHPLYNVTGLAPAELAARSVVHLDISSKEYVSLAAGEDPSVWTSVSASPPRGPLPAGGAWRTAAAAPRMVAVKVAALHFGKRGIQGRVEAWGQRYGMRNSFVRYNRRIVCWMDEWLALSMADIRRLEAEVKRQLGGG